MGELGFWVCPKPVLFFQFLLTSLLNSQGHSPTNNTLYPQNLPEGAHQLLPYHPTHPYGVLCIDALKKCPENFERKVLNNTTRWLFCVHTISFPLIRVNHFYCTEEGVLSFDVEMLAQLTLGQENVDFSKGTGVSPSRERGLALTDSSEQEFLTSGLSKSSKPWHYMWGFAWMGTFV